MRRIQAVVQLVEKTDEGTQVILKSSASGRRLHMMTTRASYCRGQEIKLTCEKIARDGEIINPRYGGQIPYLFPRKVKGKTATREDKIEDLSERLKQFKGISRPRGRLLIQGGYEVSIDRRLWFFIHLKGEKDRLMSNPCARDAARWLADKVLGDD